MFPFFFVSDLTMDKGMEASCIELIESLLSDNGKMLLRSVGEHLPSEFNEGVMQSGGWKKFFLQHPHHFDVISDISVALSAVRFIELALFKHKVLRLDKVGDLLRKGHDQGKIVYDLSQGLKSFLGNYPKIFTVRALSKVSHVLELTTSPQLTLEIREQEIAKTSSAKSQMKEMSIDGSLQKLTNHVGKVTVSMGNMGTLHTSMGEVFFKGEVCQFFKGKRVDGQIHKGDILVCDAVLGPAGTRCKWKATRVWLPTEKASVDSSSTLSNCIGNVTYISEDGKYGNLQTSKGVIFFSCNSISLPKGKGYRNGDVKINDKLMCNAELGPTGKRCKWKAVKLWPPKTEKNDKNIASKAPKAGRISSCITFFKDILKQNRELSLTRIGDHLSEGPKDHQNLVKEQGGLKSFLSSVEGEFSVSDVGMVTLVSELQDCTGVVMHISGNNGKLKIQQGDVYFHSDICSFIWGQDLEDEIAVNDILLCNAKPVMISGTCAYEAVKVWRPSLKETNYFLHLHTSSVELNEESSKGAISKESTPIKTGTLTYANVAKNVRTNLKTDDEDNSFPAGKYFFLSERILSVN